MGGRPMSPAESDWYEDVANLHRRKPARNPGNRPPGNRKPRQTRGRLERRPPRKPERRRPDAGRG